MVVIGSIGHVSDTRRAVWRTLEERMESGQALAMVATHDERIMLHPAFDDFNIFELMIYQLITDSVKRKSTSTVTL